VLGEIGRHDAAAHVQRDALSEVVYLHDGLAVEIEDASVIQSSGFHVAKPQKGRAPSEWTLTQRPVYFVCARDASPTRRPRTRPTHDPRPCGSMWFTRQVSAYMEDFARGPGRACSVSPSSGLA